MTLRVGLAGAGVAGERHASALRMLSATDAGLVALAGVHDAVTGRAHALAARFGCRAEDSLGALLKQCDALIVATPASTHADLALQALAAGCHVLVERPLAHARKPARAIVEAARTAGLVLHIGHREGPMLEALGLANAPEPVLRFEAVRETPPREHLADVSVILDLMVQDLFVACGLFTAKAVAVKAVKLAGRPGVTDAAEARIRFAGGGQAVIRASRVAAMRQALWKVEHPSGSLRADFVQGHLQRRLPWPGPASLPVQDRDPVAQGLAAFVSACREGVQDLDGAATRNALAAVELAVHIEGILADAL